MTHDRDINLDGRRSLNLAKLREWFPRWEWSADKLLVEGVHNYRTTMYVGTCDARRVVIYCESLAEYADDEPPIAWIADEGSGPVDLHLWWDGQPDAMSRAVVAATVRPDVHERDGELDPIPNWRKGP